MAKFKCRICGYIEDDEAPEECSKCGAPKDQFEQLSSDVDSLIERSRVTNDLHMTLIGLCSDIIELAEAGMDEKLDPECVKIFERAHADAIETKQTVKAELESHMRKQKWG